MTTREPTLEQTSVGTERSCLRKAGRVGIFPKDLRHSTIFLRLAFEGRVRSRQHFLRVCRNSEPGSEDSYCGGVADREPGIATWPHRDSSAMMSVWVFCDVLDLHSVLRVIRHNVESGESQRPRGWNTRCAPLQVA